jgi:hypothetical protein
MFVQISVDLPVFTFMEKPVSKALSDAAERGCRKKEVCGSLKR